MSTYSAGLSTVRILTEPVLAAVAGRFVFVLVGARVCVAVDSVGVSVGVTVAGLGVVGHALGATRVGKGVAPKLNKAVGVACVPCVG